MKYCSFGKSPRSIKDLQAQVGHKDDRMIMRIYAHINARYLQEARNIAEHFSSTKLFNAPNINKKETKQTNEKNKQYYCISMHEPTQKDHVDCVKIA